MFEYTRHYDDMVWKIMLRDLLHILQYFKSSKALKIALKLEKYETLKSSKKLN